MEKLVSQIAIKSDGDAFFEIWRKRLYEISDMSPANVKSVDLLEGQWGTVGSVIFWNYIQDGKELVAKEIVESIDEEKKSVILKVIEGNLLEQYKNFNFTVHVDANGDGNMVTWILEFEKINQDVPDPQSMMDVCLATTKDIDTSLNPNTAQAPAPVFARM